MVLTFLLKRSTRVTANDAAPNINGCAEKCTARPGYTSNSSLNAFLLAPFPSPLPFRLSFTTTSPIANEQNWRNAFRDTAPLIHGYPPHNTMWAMHERQDMMYGWDIEGDGWSGECRNGFWYVYENMTLTKRFIEGALVFGISLLLTRIRAMDTWMTWTFTNKLNCFWKIVLFSLLYLYLSFLFIYLWFRG